mmetsp:Transcript_18594/g.46062  ORF Transcript_18594/g.46062 Transcript_18594/m.46062 type:complete len:136 (-) Transcript_18594:390-797(-)
MAPTVCDIKVVETNIKKEEMHSVCQGLSDLYSMKKAILSAKESSNPEDLMDSPKARPPIARKTTPHKKLLRSSFDKMPVPKKTMKGIMPKTPISPVTPESVTLEHQSNTTPIVTDKTKYCSPDRGSDADRFRFSA